MNSNNFFDDEDFDENFNEDFYSELEDWIEESEKEYSSCNRESPCRNCMDCLGFNNADFI